MIYSKKLDQLRTSVQQTQIIIIETLIYSKKVDQFRTSVQQTQIIIIETLIYSKKIDQLGTSAQQTCCNNGTERQQFKMSCIGISEVGGSQASIIVVGVGK